MSFRHERARRSDPGAGVKTSPFWREGAPFPRRTPTPPPKKVDAVVIGGGFTGLSAALALAEGGWSVAVLDAGRVGDGASGRNGGMIGWGHRARLGALSKRFGRDAALALLGEARESYAFTTDLIRRLGLRCGLRLTGRYLAAASPKHFKQLTREMAETGPLLGFPHEVLSKADQAAEIVTDAYSGGVLLPSHGRLQPALFVDGLAEASVAAGAMLVEQVEATDIVPHGSGFRVATTSGAQRDEIIAGAVAIAANGYVGRAGAALAPFAEAMIPLPSTIIATEPLDPGRLKALLPGDRAYVDTRSTHSYFSIDGSGARLLWGGRASLSPLSPEVAAARLLAHMGSVLPELRDVAVTHSWSGKIAYTLDVTPQIGRFASGPLDKVWYAGGYCGSGVAMAPYLGWRLAQKMLGTKQAACAFDAAALRRVPAYRLAPLALRGVELWHKILDWRDGVRAAR